MEDVLKMANNGEAISLINFDINYVNTPRQAYSRLLPTKGTSYELKALAHIYCIGLRDHMVETSTLCVFCAWQMQHFFRGTQGWISKFSCPLFPFLSLFFASS